MLILNDTCNQSSIHHLTAAFSLQLFGTNSLELLLLQLSHEQNGELVSRCRILRTPALTPPHV